MQMRFSIFVFFLFFFSCVYSQNEDAFCRTFSNEGFDGSPSNRSVFQYCGVGAFNPQFIQDNCYEVWIRVNVHFLVSSTTGRTVAKPGQPTYLPSEAYQVAQNLLSSANGFNENIGDNAPWNQAYYGVPVTAPQCVPFRYLLNRVVFHPEGTSDNTIRFDPVYEDGMNLVVKNTPSDGYAFVNSDFAAVGNFSPQNVVHELGHNFNLEHTHDVDDLHDGCTDTWFRPKESWDANEDGDPEYVNNNRCWNDSPQGKISPNVGPNDPTFDYCVVDSVNVLSQHPCCFDYNQNNNVMTHSGYATQASLASLTPCQVGRALTNIGDTKCDLIEDVNPICRPTSAFIGVTPSVDFTIDCSFVFRMKATVHETDHRIYIEILDNGVYSMFYDSDWISGGADVFRVAVATDLNDKFADLILLADKSYRITLETQNTCDTDSYTYEFSTRAGCDMDIVGPVSIGDVEVYPNPFWDGTRLIYSLSESKDVQIFTSGISNDE